MKKTYTIGCLNCQNNRHNRLSFKKKKRTNPASILAKHMKQMNYDILGTQEITKPFLEQLKKEIKNYGAYGTYRFGDNYLSHHLPLIKTYNENNNILLKDDVLETKTIHLPFLKGALLDGIRFFNKGTLLPRIATVAVSNNQKMGTICIINTHLTHRISKIKAKQLVELKKIIETYSKKYPVVLMGDFNMTTSFDPFQQFIKEMKYLGIKRVPIDEVTHRHSKAAIDHIFVPKNWKVVESGIIIRQDPSISSITDHTGIYVKVENS